MAEREGFEPPVPLSTAVFKTAVIDHSTISPNFFSEGLSFRLRCKGTTFLFICKQIRDLFFEKCCFFCLYLYNCLLQKLFID